MERVKREEQLRRLAGLDLYLHPCRAEDHAYMDRNGKPQVAKAKSPHLPAGHDEASNDLDTILKWWKRWPDALPGVHAGRSGLVCLDIDKDADKGIDGWQSLDADGRLPLPDTFHYLTRRGGSHYVYKAPEGVRLNGVKDYLGMRGVDRRGGSSYFIWWADTVPATRKAFK